MNRHDFDLELKGLVRELREMGAQGPAIMARALNRAGTSGKTAMKKAVSADTGIAQKGLERQIKVDKANKTRPSVSLTISGTPMPLIDFQGRGPEPSRGKGKGATYRSPSGGRKQVPGGFIAMMKSGHRGIFVRKPRTSTRHGRTATKPQLPIVERKTPPLPHWFGKRLTTFKEAAQESLRKALKHEISFAKSKQTGE